MPKTSRPTRSASSISSSRLCMRSTGLSVKPVAASEMAAAKLSIPICIYVAPPRQCLLDCSAPSVVTVHFESITHPDGRYGGLRGVPLCFDQRNFQLDFQIVAHQKSPGFQLPVPIKREIPPLYPRRSRGPYPG